MALAIGETQPIAGPNIAQLPIDVSATPQNATIVATRLGKASCSPVVPRSNRHASANQKAVSTFEALSQSAIQRHSDKLCIPPAAPIEEMASAAAGWKPPKPLSRQFFAQYPALNAPPAMSACHPDNSEHCYFCFACLKPRQAEQEDQPAAAECHAIALQPHLLSQAEYQLRRRALEDSWLANRLALANAEQRAQRIGLALRVGDAGSEHQAGLGELIQVAVHDRRYTERFVIARSERDQIKAIGSCCHQRDVAGQTVVPENQPKITLRSLEIPNRRSVIQRIGSGFEDDQSG